MAGVAAAFVAVLVVGPRGAALRASVFAPAYSFPQIDRDEEVTFYSPYLYWNESAELVLVVRGRFIEPERSGLGRRITIDRAIRPALFRYIGKDEQEYDVAAHTRMVSRLLPFLADGESGVALKMRLVGRGGSGVLTLPKTGAGGQFALATTTAAGASIADLVGNGAELRVEAVLPAGDRRQFAALPRVPPRDLPLLVISDVDDTVRIGEILDRPRMIERVFLYPYEAVPGMSIVYNQLADRRAQFHFVSGSPWQISGLIERLLADESFPPSVLHCRQLSWDFWNADPVDTKEFKIGTIKTLLQQFRQSKVLLVGDDGEHDPEAYTEVCRAHADRVVGIWIRRVRAEPPDERLTIAKGLLGDGRVVAFKDAQELAGPVARLDASP